MGVCAGKENKKVTAVPKEGPTKRTQPPPANNEPTKKTKEPAYNNNSKPAKSAKPTKVQDESEESVVVEKSPKGDKKKKSTDTVQDDKENTDPSKGSKKAKPEPEVTPAEKSPKPKKTKEADATVETEPRKTLEEATAETEALYKKYRGEADEHAKLRSKYMEESKAAFDAGDKGKAKELSEKGKEEGRLMDEAGLRAARAIFMGKNESQPDGTIDLHGLHVKEAEMIVKEELAAAKKKGLAELKIIIGAGHHSGKEGPKVGPAIKKLLDEAEYKWAMDETNASGGALIATL